MKLVLCICIAVLGLCEARASAVDEFFIHGPDDLHKSAMKSFLDARKEDPRNDKMDIDSPIMQRARAHAVKRLAAKDESELKIRVSSCLSERSFFFFVILFHRDLVVM